MEEYLSLTMFAKTHNINRTELLNFLVEKGVISDINAITEKGEKEYGLKYKYGEGGSKWPVYSTQIEELIKDHVFTEPLSVPKTTNTAHRATTKEIAPIEINEKLKDVVLDFSKLGLSNFVIFDTETTSLDLDDEVIEYGIIDEKGNTLYNSLFYTEKKINVFASKKSNIWNKDLIGKPKFIDEWEKIAKILDGKLIIAHNAVFDIRLTIQTLIKNNIQPKELERAIKILSNYKCSIELTKQYIKDRKSYSLENLCKDYNITTEQTHRATDDCVLVLLWLNQLNKLI